MKLELTAATDAGHVTNYARSDAEAAAWLRTWFRWLDSCPVVSIRFTVRELDPCARCGADKPRGQSCDCFDNGCQ